MANYIVLGTWNTKHEELDFICEEMRRRSHQPIPLDLSTRNDPQQRDIDHPSIHFDWREAKLKEIAKKEAYLRCQYPVGGEEQIFSWQQK